jgi:hypothetical protein
VLGELDAHEQTAVGAADDAESAGRGDLAGDEIAAYGGEVIVDALAVGLEAGFVPGWTELAASANVSEDRDATALKPELAEDS